MHSTQRGGSPLDWPSWSLLVFVEQTPCAVHSQSFPFSHALGILGASCKAYFPCLLPRIVQVSCCASLSPPRVGQRTCAALVALKREAPTTPAGTKGRACWHGDCSP